MKCVFSLTFLFITLNLFSQKKLKAQSKPRYATEKEYEIIDFNNDCINHKTKSFKSRLKEYPLNKTAQIQLVSFKSSFDSKAGEYYRDSLPRINDTVCYTKLFEVTNLTLLQSDSLTEILYNIGYRTSLDSRKYNNDESIIYIASRMQCYNPRNAILFLDNQSKVLEFIEICFECERTRESSHKINLGEMCNQKIELIKNFFKVSGIRYGIVKGFGTNH